MAKGKVGAGGQKLKGIKCKAKRVEVFQKLKKEGDVTTFALDFCRPISALVAFGVALSAFEAEA